MYWKLIGALQPDAVPDPRPLAARSTPACLGVDACMLHARPSGFGGDGPPDETSVSDEEEGERGPSNAGYITVTSTEKPLYGDDAVTAGPPGLILGGGGGGGGGPNSSAEASPPKVNSLGLA